MCRNPTFPVYFNLCEFLWNLNDDFSTFRVWRGMWIYNPNQFNTKVLCICFKNARFRELSLTVLPMTPSSFSLSPPPQLPLSPSVSGWNPVFHHSSQSIRSCLSEFRTDSTGMKLYCWLTWLQKPEQRLLCIPLKLWNLTQKACSGSWKPNLCHRSLTLVGKEARSVGIRRRPKRVI